MIFNSEISRKSAYAAFIILIILLSFRLFSTIFYPLVNSDEGVIVLMLHYFKFPHDLYFWGQNRYGAIVPLLGQIPYRLFGLSSLVSEAVTHYLLLIAGFIAFSTFIKSKIYRVLFAAVWFFPPLYYTDLLRNVFGLQYSVIGILFFLLNKYQPAYQAKILCAKLPFYLLLLVLAIVACWVSDLFVTSIAAFLIVKMFFLFKEDKIRFFIRKSEIYFLIAGLLLTYLVITYLKSIADVGSFDKYGDKLLIGFPGAVKSVRLFSSTIGSILSFQIPDFLFSIYSYLTIILFILTLIFYKKIKFGNQESRWVAVFILDGVILILVILLSNWAYINGMPRRYFVGAYISFWLAFLMLLSHFSPGGVKTVISVLAGLAIGIGVLSTVYSYKFIFPQSLRPKAELVREFNRLGKTGIIADYWNSYGNSFADPDLIKATPFEHSGAVRNPGLVDSVFSQPKIILIKDMWMDDFPDTIIQFNRTLIRKDSAFFIGDSWANEYIVKTQP
jgi:hypothetical protein